MIHFLLKEKKRKKFKFMLWYLYLFIGLNKKKKQKTHLFCCFSLLGQSTLIFLSVTSCIHQVFIKKKNTYSTHKRMPICVAEAIFFEATLTCISFILLHNSIRPSRSHILLLIDTMHRPYRLNQS
jgi:hypothetical protein